MKRPGDDDALNGSSAGRAVERVGGLCGSLAVSRRKPPGWFCRTVGLPSATTVSMIYNIPIDDIRYIQTNITITNKEAIMASEIRKHKRLGAIALRPRRGFRTAGLVALAVAVLVAATAVFQFDTTHAAGRVATGLDVLETYAVAQDFSGSARTAGVWDLGTDAMTASWPDIPTYSNVAGSGTEEAAGPAREVHVWATFMTVGMATDGNMTYTGIYPAQRWEPKAAWGTRRSPTAIRITPFWRYFTNR